MSVEPARQTGLLGGSFDPVHATHVALACAARDHLALDEVQLLPADTPWQRAPLGASGEHRVAMLELATQGHPGLRVNPIEIGRPGRTYTIDTLRAMGAGEDPAHRFHWILGGDQLANFCTWADWPEIAARTRLTVAVRGDIPTQIPEALRRELERLDTPLINLPFTPSPISATDIRRRAAAGLPLDGLVPASVAQYIRTHHLYQT